MASPLHSQRRMPLAWATGIGPLTLSLDRLSVSVILYLDWVMNDPEKAVASHIKVSCKQCTLDSPPPPPPPLQDCWLIFQGDIPKISYVLTSGQLGSPGAIFAFGQCFPFDDASTPGRGPFFAFVADIMRLARLIISLYMSASASCVLAYNLTVSARTDRYCL